MVNMWLILNNGQYYVATNATNNSGYWLYTHVAEAAGPETEEAQFRCENWGIASHHYCQAASTIADCSTNCKSK